MALHLWNSILSCLGLANIFIKNSLKLKIFEGFGTPLLAFFHIRRNLVNLHEVEFKKAYGFLYDGYRMERYFWEFVILYRKIAMIFILVFLVAYPLEIQVKTILL